jgi:hypothetical protein
VGPEDELQATTASSPNGKVMHARSACVTSVRRATSRWRARGGAEQSRAEVFRARSGPCLDLGSEPLIRHEIGGARAKMPSVA